MWLPVVAIVGSALFLMLGYRHPRFRQPVLRSGLAADVLHALVNGVLLDLPIAVTLQWITTGVGQSPGTAMLRLLANEPLWLQAAVFLVGGDLVKWILHVLQHRVPLLWRLHRLHHSTEQLDAISYARTHPLECLLNRVVFMAVFIVIAGIDVRIVLCYSALDLLQGLWVHSNTHMRTGWLNYILATQEFHHWHHAKDPRAIDKNFGGFLSVWDWMFGTAYCPRDREVPGFGTADLWPPPTRYRDHLLAPFRPQRSAGSGREEARRKPSEYEPELI
jgi:sterol desaturase/sphingolipid hydroxylase (fatty acid hydroxylase superfamily)